MNSGPLEYHFLKYYIMQLFIMSKKFSVRVILQVENTIKVFVSSNKG